MSTLTKLLPLYLALAGFFAASSANALTVECDVDITYQPAGATVPTDQYTQHFTVGIAPQVTFEDDLSTSTRQKRFQASIVRINTKPYVVFRYDRDVAAITSIAVNGELLIRGGATPQVTNGNYGFWDSRLGVTTFNNTNYTLSCARVVMDTTGTDDTGTLP